LVTGSIPVAATKPLQSPEIEQGIHQNRQVYLPVCIDQGISITEAIKGFLLSCKVEGKSYNSYDSKNVKLSRLWIEERHS
jgi:hypothetical protein